MSETTSSANDTSLRVTGIAALLLFLGLAVYLLPLEPNILALQFAWSAGTFRGILEQWQPDGVALFRSHLPVDFVLLVAYGTFGYLLTKRTSLFANYAALGRMRIAVLLPVAAIADAMEDLLHWYLTGGHLNSAGLLVPIATAYSALKFAGLAVFGVLALHAYFQKRR